MRRTAIRRRSPMRRRPLSASKYARRPRDTEHMLRVKQLPCAVGELIPHPDACTSVIEADHVGRRGIGRKCADTETIPLCSYHHRCRHGFAGIFRAWVQADMRGFITNALEWTASKLAARG